MYHSSARAPRIFPHTLAMATRGQNFTLLLIWKLVPWNNVTAFSLYTWNPSEDLHTCAPTPPLSPYLQTFRSLSSTKHTEMQQAIHDIAAEWGVTDPAFCSLYSDGHLLSQPGYKVVLKSFVEEQNECDAYSTYFFGWKQESLDCLKVWKKLCFFNNMHSIFIADSFVQGSSIWNNKTMYLSKIVKIKGGGGRRGTDSDYCSKLSQ